MIVTTKLIEELATGKTARPAGMKSPAEVGRSQFPSYVRGWFKPPAGQQEKASTSKQN